MEFIQGWLPLVLGIVAVLIAIFRRPPTADEVNLEGVLEEATEYLGEGAEILSAGAEFVQEVAPSALKIVLGVRQLFNNDELQLEELKPAAMAQLREIFPNVKEKTLELALEGAVFTAKKVFKELWHRLPQGDDASTDDTEAATEADLEIPYSPV